MTKKLYNITMATGLALALTGCMGSNNSPTTPIKSKSVKTEKVNSPYLATAKTDKDKDGIMDISDQCPNTIPGTKVSADGCKIYFSITDLDVKEICSIEKNGIKAVIATAAKYNKTAKEHGVEFKRLGMTNTQYIDGVNNALKTGGKEVVLLNKKGKPDKKLKPVSVEYAAQRACKFAISALTQEANGKMNWKDAMPGKGK